MTTLSTPTVDEVRSVITTSLSDAQVLTMIADAALVVSRCPSIADAPESVQSAVVRWAAAHLIAIREPSGLVTQKSMGDASESYARAPLGVGLSGTFYGQQAILLDPTGCLERLGRQRAFMRVL